MKKRVTKILFAQQIYFIGWAAISLDIYILNESALYSGESVGRAKYKQDVSNVLGHWMAFNEKFIVHCTHHQ